MTRQHQTKTKQCNSVWLQWEIPLYNCLSQRSPNVINSWNAGRKTENVCLVLGKGILSLNYWDCKDERMLFCAAWCWYAPAPSSGGKSVVLRHHDAVTQINKCVNLVYSKILFVYVQFCVPATCMLLAISGQPLLEGLLFSLQYNTYPTDTHTYISTARRNGELLFLYYKADR